MAGLAPAGSTSTARIYDYLLGGKDNNAADRQAAEQLLRALPDAALVARANRAFLAAAVRQVAANGVTQFVDIGPGFPATPNVHESARSVAPAARVAYVDYDAEVVARTQEVLAGDDLVTAFGGNARDSTAILEDPRLGSLINLAEPVCVLFLSVLHFLPPAEADAAVAAVRERVAPGSYLVITAGVNNEQNAPAQGLVQVAYSANTLLAGRPKAEIAAYFADLELVPPGLVPVTEWPTGDPAGDAAGDAGGGPGSGPGGGPGGSKALLMAEILAGVGRKPG
ncbi:MAG TPA: SAM-dependent methyltransferase [Streptosporangiaceae bacterium]|nr:SAM-dependent methyltransferase [Streptosporangiaceae bacterium]